MPRPAYVQPDLVALAGAPVLMGAAMLLDLTPHATSTTELLGLVAEDPGRWTLANVLYLCAGVAWTVAAVGLLRRLGSRSRIVALGAVGLTAGGVAMGLIEATMAYVPALARSGVPVTDQVEVVEALDGSAVVLTFELVHIVGWLGGLLLIVVGLFLTRAVPRWVPATLLAGLVGMVVLVTGPGLVVALAALAAGSIGLAAHLRGPARGRTTHPRDGVAYTSSTSEAQTAARSALPSKPMPASSGMVMWPSSTSTPSGKPPKG